MTVHFYDHPSGVVYFSAPSGGGGGQTSVFEAPATHKQIEDNQKEYKEYLRLKEHGSVELKNAPTDIVARNLYISNLEHQVAEMKAEIERLRRHVHPG